MTIPKLDENQFKSILKEYLTPARAISSPEHLKGRESTLTQIDRTFNSPGKHVFIFGDRGAGKTSLAQTAAILQQSSSSYPPLVSCGQGSFLNTTKSALRRILPTSNKKIEHKISLGIPGISYEFLSSLSLGSIPDFDSVNDAVSIFDAISKIKGEESVIIFDEFDQINNDSDKKICADLIKQISDQGVNVRFIFCGIGRSLQDLIGAHLSSGRYIFPVELERLSHDARWLILQSAATAMGVTIGTPHLTRIGQISDGFPSYVHLIGEKVFWSMFDDSQNIIHCSQEHFNEGVNVAIKESESTLKILYDKATQKHSDNYQEVLWAIADGHDLRRQTTSIYEKSYLRIMCERNGRKKLNKSQFSAHLIRLKDDRHGEIIRGTGAGWYEFRENIVRGYARLRAQQAGIKLGVEGYA